MAPVKKTVTKKKSSTIKKKTSVKIPEKKKTLSKTAKAALGLTGLAALGTAGYLANKYINKKSVPVKPIVQTVEVSGEESKKEEQKQKSDQEKKDQKKKEIEESKKEEQKQKSDQEKKEFMDKLEKLVDIKNEVDLKKECKSLQDLVLTDDLKYMHKDIEDKCAILFEKFHSAPAAVPTVIPSKVGLLKQIQDRQTLKKSPTIKKEKKLSILQEELLKRRGAIEGEPEDGKNKNQNLDFEQEW